MTEKNIKSRIINKHETDANWAKATGFIPKQGEIIVYDIDSIYAYERFKIGDGATNVNSLPFVIDGFLNQARESGDLRGNKGYTPVKGLDYWTDEDKSLIKAYVDAAITNILERSCTVDAMKITSTEENVTYIDSGRITSEEEITDCIDAGQITTVEDTNEYIDSMRVTSTEEITGYIDAMSITDTTDDYTTVDAGELYSINWR